MIKSQWKKRNHTKRCGFLEFVEKPEGLFDSFLQSAARTPCAPLAHNSHTCSLRCVFVHVHAAAKNDSDFIYRYK